MRKYVYAASLLSLSSCSGLWTTYQVLEDMPMSDVADMAENPDLLVDPCNGKQYYKMDSAEPTLVACCSNPDQNNGGTNQSNVMATIRDSQNSTMFPGNSVTIRFSCAGTALGTMGFSRADASVSALFAPITRQTVIDGLPLNMSSANSMYPTVLHANQNSRHFIVNSGGSLWLQNLHLKGGKATDMPAAHQSAYPAAQGKAPVAAGGSIVSMGEIKLDRVAFLDNRVEGSAHIRGGAIFILNGKLSTNNSIFYGNNLSALNGATLAATDQAAGAAISVVNGNVLIGSSTILKNEALSGYNGTEYKGVIDVFEQMTGAGGAYSITVEKSLIVNSLISSAPAVNTAVNYGLSVNCTTGVQLNGSVSAGNVIDTVNNQLNTSTGKASCPSFTAPSSPIPGELVAKTAIFNHPISRSHPGGQIVASGLTDLLLIGAAKLSCAGDLDFFGVNRVGTLCMPGAEVP